MPHQLPLGTRGPDLLRPFCVEYLPHWMIFSFFRAMGLKHLLVHPQPLQLRFGSTPPPRDSSDS
eukprot:7582026-Pyramimonas_sp.AAC.1